MSREADVVEHELSEDCVCGPSVMPVQREDGSFGWVYIHHQLAQPRTPASPRPTHPERKQRPPEGQAWG